MNEITVLIAGDFCAKSPELIEIDQELKQIIAEADVSVLNFEGPLKTSNFNMPNKTVLPQSDKSPKWCEQNGFNIISLANNHINDFGQEGIVKTIRGFNDSKVIGIGRWEEAYAVHYETIKGITIGFMPLSSADLGSLQDKWTESDRLGSAWINHPSVDYIILSAKKKCDYLIVLPHAGVEHIPFPLPEWRDRYQALVDMGADAVIANHPHIIQGFEIYKGSPIYYSLGNFFFDYFSNRGKPKHWDDGLVVKLKISDVGIESSYVFTRKKNNAITIIKDLTTYNKFQEITLCLKDEKLYMKKIEDAMLERAPIFLSWLFSSLVNLSITNRLKIILALIRGVRQNNKLAIHQIREESTRYSIIRYLKRLK